MTEDYYRKMENNSTSELVDMIRERDKQIAELEKEKNDDLFDSNKPAKYMGADLEYVFRQLCEAREIIAIMIFKYESRKGHVYSTVMKGKELLRKGVFSENL